MKLVLLAGALYFICKSGVGWSQDMDDASKTFKTFTFDTVHRGSFNITLCVKDLINCWETIKPDIVCSTPSYGVYESVCGLLREQCHDEAGYDDNSGFTMFESYCRPDGDERWT